MQTAVCGREKNINRACPKVQASSGNILSKVNISIVNVGSGSHSTDWNSKWQNNQRHDSQANPSNGDHWGTWESHSWDGCGKEALVKCSGSRHSQAANSSDGQRWQKALFQGHLFLFGKKLKSLLGIEKKNWWSTWLLLHRISENCCKWGGSKACICVKDYLYIQKWILPSAKSGCFLLPYYSSAPSFPHRKKHDV